MVSLGSIFRSNREPETKDVASRSQRIDRSLRQTEGYDTTGPGNSKVGVGLARQAVADVRQHGVVDHLDSRVLEHPEANEKAAYEINRYTELVQQVAGNPECSPAERAIAHCALTLAQADMLPHNTPKVEPSVIWAALANSAHVLAHFPLGAAAGPALGAFGRLLVRPHGLTDEYAALTPTDACHMGLGVLHVAVALDTVDGSSSEWPKEWANRVDAMTRNAAHNTLAEYNDRTSPLAVQRYSLEDGVGLLRSRLGLIQDLDPQPWHK